MGNGFLCFLCTLRDCVKRDIGDEKTHEQHMKRKEHMKYTIHTRRNTLNLHIKIEIKTKVRVSLPKRKTKTEQLV